MACEIMLTNDVLQLIIHFTERGFQGFQLTAVSPVAFIKQCIVWKVECRGSTTNDIPGGYLKAPCVLTHLNLHCFIPLLCLPFLMICHHYVYNTVLTGRTDFRGFIARYQHCRSRRFAGLFISNFRLYVCFVVCIIQLSPCSHMPLQIH